MALNFKPRHVLLERIAIRGVSVWPMMHAGSQRAIPQDLERLLVARERAGPREDHGPL